MTADAILRIVLNVADGLVVYPAMVGSYVQAELPFMATENIIMAGVQAGGDRQELHELIRQHSHAAAAEVKNHGRPNDLLDRLRADENFAGIDIDALLDPTAFVGRAPEQVDDFLAKEVAPIRTAYKDALGQQSNLRV
jgi:adenylosuccinate lyase